MTIPAISGTSATSARPISLRPGFAPAPEGSGQSPVLHFRRASSSCLDGPEAHSKKDPTKVHAITKTLAFMDYTQRLGSDAAEAAQPARCFNCSSLPSVLRHAHRPPARWSRFRDEYLLFPCAVSTVSARGLGAGPAGPGPGRALPYRDAACTWLCGHAQPPTADRVGG